MLRENALLEEERYKDRVLKKKELWCGIGRTIGSLLEGLWKTGKKICFITIFGIVVLAYLIIPLDLMPGIIFDDIIVCYLCFKAIKRI